MEPCARSARVVGTTARVRRRMAERTGSGTGAIPGGRQYFTGMQFEVFTVPAGGGEAMAELNRFLGSHRVIGVEKHLVTVVGSGPVWVFCVEYLQGYGVERRVGSGGTGVAKVDYREVLDAADFAVFSRLREVRKAMAEKEGVPPYTIFTNEQLASMVRQRVSTKSALEKIEGIGAARIEKYGAAVIETLGAAWVTVQPEAVPAEIESSKGDTVPFKR